MPDPLKGTSIIGYSRGTGPQSIGRAPAGATGTTLEPEFFAATVAEVDRAAKLAAKAFPVYSGWSGKKRAAFLRRIAEEIEALGDALVKRAMAETSLPEGRIVGERGRTCSQLRLFADLVEEGSWVDARIEHALPDRQPLPKPDLRSMLRPIGPVAVFCAGNFPLAFSVAGGDAASALAAGCPIVVNAHSGHLGTAEMIAAAVVSAAHHCQAPEGVFSLLIGAGYETGQALVKHPAIRGVGFTGSRTGGRALMDLAAARREPIPVFAEMSSVNPFFILPKALAERWGAIAAGLHQSITAGAGQFCTKPGLIFLPAGKDADLFVEKLRGLIGETPLCPMLNPGIASNFESKRDQLASVPAVQTLAEGPGAQAGLFVTTARVFLENGLLHDEVFGPVALIVLCDGEAQLQNCAEAIEGQLTATVHAEESDAAAHVPLLATLQRKAGRLIFNGYPTGLEVCHATTHGGPYPATSDGRSTSVGTGAILRWVRPVAFQSHPGRLLPDALKDENPLKIWRLVDGKRVH